MQLACYDQGCGFVFIFSGSGSRVWGWRPIRIQGFNDQTLKKNYSWKFFFILFFSKTAIYLSLGLHKVCPSYRRSLQFSKEAIQSHMCGSGYNPDPDPKHLVSTVAGLLLWVIFALLDPDPDPQTRLNTDPIRIRIHNPGLDVATLCLNSNTALKIQIHMLCSGQWR